MFTPKYTYKYTKIAGEIMSGAEKIKKEMLP